jgi:hypothetical protein
MQQIILEPLTDYQAARLLLSTCTREINKEELGIPLDSTQTVEYQLQLEENFRKCKNLPFYLIQYAEKLSY